MALAAQPEVLLDDAAEEMPWPRPVLRLVAPAAEEPPAVPGPPALALRTGPDVAERRHLRASAKARRRRVLAGLLVAGVLAVLALPASALGGTPVVTHRAAPASGTTYVVQPGDTLWSIANRVGGARDPRALVRELASETGSDAVYPGEQIAVP